MCWRVLKGAFTAAASEAVEVPIGRITECTVLNDQQALQKRGCNTVNGCHVACDEQCLMAINMSYLVSRKGGLEDVHM
jgi:hypothetical protein